MKLKTFANFAASCIESTVSDLIDLGALLAKQVLSILISAIVSWILWNQILPFGLGALSFIQVLGLVVIARLFFTRPNVEVNPALTSEELAVLRQSYGEDGKPTLRVVSDKKDGDR